MRAMARPLKIGSARMTLARFSPVKRRMAH
jgi:hypothetical protein